MEQRAGVVSFQGNPLTLLGLDVTPGQTAPDFTVVDEDFKPVKLSDFSGRVLLISAVPSLDMSSSLGCVDWATTLTPCAHLIVGSL